MNSPISFKRGDKVKVWSLQSWQDGGFINGEEGIVVQDSHGGSVIVALVRNIGGEYKLDTNYEVYPEQCRLVEAAQTLPSSYQLAKEKLKKFAKTIRPKRKLF